MRKNIFIRDFFKKIAKIVSFSTFFGRIPKMKNKCFLLLAKNVKLKMKSKKHFVGECFLNVDISGF